MSPSTPSTGDETQSPQPEQQQEVTLEHPEVHQPHVRHGGGLPRWLELVIAVTALITSISSIAIAVHHGEIMDRLVQANSIPYLQGGFSDVTPEGTRVLSLDLFNRGVGPAHERSLQVTVEGRNVTSVDQLLDVALGPTRAAEAKKVFGTLMRNQVKTRFIPGGLLQPVFRVVKTPENASYWEMLEQEQVKWDVEYCYCSVFEDCWRVTSKWNEPEPVEECVRDEAKEFLP
jgi:hypothetical protein